MSIKNFIQIMAITITMNSSLFAMHNSSENFFGAYEIKTLGNAPKPIFHENIVLEGRQECASQWSRAFWYPSVAVKHITLQMDASEILERGNEIFENFKNILRQFPNLDTLLIHYNLERDPSVNNLVAHRIGNFVTTLLREVPFRISFGPKLEQVPHVGHTQARNSRPNEAAYRNSAGKVSQRRLPPKRQTLSPINAVIIEDPYREQIALNPYQPYNTPALEGYFMSDEDFNFVLSVYQNETIRQQQTLREILNAAQQIGVDIKDKEFLCLVQNINHLSTERKERLYNLLTSSYVLNVGLEGGEVVHKNYKILLSLCNLK